MLQAATGGDTALFSCCVDIDHAALDTIGNAEESAKWVRSHDYGSVILVTNNYHMPRSLLEMGRLLGKEELEPYPVVNSRLDNGGWIVQAGRAARAVHRIQQISGCAGARRAAARPADDGRRW